MEHANMRLSWHRVRDMLLSSIACAMVLPMLTFSGCGGDAYTAAIDKPNNAVDSQTSERTDEKSVQVQKSASPDRILDKTFDDIKFDIEPDAPFERAMITPEIEALDGQRMRIRGYILPTLRKRGLTEFVLVRDNQECCFGPGAALYDCILVTMQPGKTAEFSIRPVAVEGRFTIEVFKPFDRVLAIYHLEGESVK
jgi:hypothetical protein